MATSLSEFMRSPQAAVPHYFVIGNPVGHSLSPFMHQIALDYVSMEAIYVAIELDSGEITKFISWMNRDHFRGCNITIPYKALFVDVVDQLDESARRAGVINTISKSGSELTGHNTDIAGFKSPLEAFSERIEGGRAIVFGTGGASMAVRIGLEELGADEIIFVSRNPGGQPQSGGQLFSKTVAYSEWQSYAVEASLIVNTTPLGMSPRVNQSPVPDEDTGLLEDKICYDLVYNPLQTKFLEQARSNGGTPITGLEMFIGQGSRSFEIWTGKPFPYERIKQQLVNKLG